MQGCEGVLRCAAPRLPPSQHHVLRERRRCSALQPRSGLGMVATEHRGRDGYPPTAGGPAWQRSRPVDIPAQAVRRTGHLRPQLSDLQQSCHAQEVAEAALLLYDESPKPISEGHSVEVIIAENGMGETGTCRMTFWPAWCRFTDES